LAAPHSSKRFIECKAAVSKIAWVYLSAPGVSVSGWKARGRCSLSCISCSNLP